ncbi:MAG TPA: type II toxin-antitoxin system VapC family toxin [Candidatus Limnocylindria bacterium]|nr:type II toxin-antitoxin system VapC family toxin [Candidatus Limnocylindria bacterium]
MILLLDTHALLWWLADDPRLADAARRSVADPANDVLASAASIWELEIKRRAGRIEAPSDILEALHVAQIDALPVTAADAVEAAGLPGHHRDPFDRMLIAQAVRLDAVVVTRDRAFAAYDVPVLVA